MESASQYQRGLNRSLADDSSAHKLCHFWLIENIDQNWFEARSALKFEVTEFFELGILLIQNLNSWLHKQAIQFLHAVLPEPSTQCCYFEASYNPSEQDAVSSLFSFLRTHLNVQAYLKQVRDTLHASILTHLQKLFNRQKSLETSPQVNLGWEKTP